MEIRWASCHSFAFVIAWVKVSQGWRYRFEKKIDQKIQGNRGPSPIPVGEDQTDLTLMQLKNMWIIVFGSPQNGHFASTFTCRLLRFSPAGRALSMAFQRRNFVFGHMRSATFMERESIVGGPCGCSGEDRDNHGSDQMDVSSPLPMTFPST